MMCSMSSQSAIGMREDGTPCSNLMDFGDAPRSLHQAPREHGAPSNKATVESGMRFAFLIHPISEQTKNLMDLDRDGRLRTTWGQADLLRFCMPRPMRAFERPFPADARTGNPTVRGSVDTFAGLVSSTGARAEGRLYEIPMDARSILTDPDRALEHMERARRGCHRLGGADRRARLDDRHHRQPRWRTWPSASPIAVTTGNSLTVYATLRNLEHYCEALGIDLADEEIAVVGIPGSIATAVAALLAPRCRRLVLGARQASPRAIQLADRLGARLEVELPKALAEASLVVTATSSGDCIEPSWLRPGCLVLDVGVPSDVRRVTPARDDVLILSAGYARVPAAMPRDSFFLRFYHGIVPSCLGETMVLALENRADSFSIGRELDLDRVREIGRLAEAHGFAFSEALACGLPLSPEARSQFLKVLSKTRPARSHRSRLPMPAADGRRCDRGRRRVRSTSPAWPSTRPSGMRGTSTPS